MTRGQCNFDELAEDSRLGDPEDCFRVNVFYKMLDIASDQISQRFAANNAEDPGSMPARTGR